MQTTLINLAQQWLAPLICEIRMLWLVIWVLKQPRPQSTKLLDFLFFDSDSENGTDDT